jgi:hypothetical protein
VHTYVCAPLAAFGTKPDEEEEEEEEDEEEE